MAACDRCAGPIVWIEMESGRKIPCNPPGAPGKTGLSARRIVRGYTRLYVDGYLHSSDRPPERGSDWRTFRAHAADCNPAGAGDPIPMPDYVRELREQLREKSR